MALTSIWSFLTGIGRKPECWDGAWTGQVRASLRKEADSFMGLHKMTRSQGAKAESDVDFLVLALGSLEKGWLAWATQSNSLKRSTDFCFLCTTGSGGVDLTCDCAKPDFFFLVVFALDPHAIFSLADINKNTSNVCTSCRMEGTLKRSWFPKAKTKPSKQAASFLLGQGF